MKSTKPASRTVGDSLWLSLAIVLLNVLIGGEAVFEVSHSSSADAVTDSSHFGAPTFSDTMATIVAVCFAQQVWLQLIPVKIRHANACIRCFGAVELLRLGIHACFGKEATLLAQAAALLPTLILSLECMHHYASSRPKHIDWRCLLLNLENYDEKSCMCFWVGMTGIVYVTISALQLPAVGASELSSPSSPRVLIGTFLCSYLSIRMTLPLRKFAVAEAVSPDLYTLTHVLHPNAKLLHGTNARLRRKSTVARSPSAGSRSKTDGETLEPTSEALASMWQKVSIGAVFANIPVVVFTRWSNPTSSLLSTFVLLNTTVRLFYPSSYCPASQSKAGWLFSPITARCLATVAEFSFCEGAGSIII